MRLIGIYDRTENRFQKAENGMEKSGFRSFDFLMYGARFLGHGQHCTEQLSNFRIVFGDFSASFDSHMVTVTGNVQTHLCCWTRSISKPL
jgi:hypothetical protein